MKILRTIQNEIVSVLESSEKIVIVYGPRQVGKTTLVRDVVKILNRKTLIVNADEEKYHPVFASRDLAKMLDLVGGYEILVIDEAQRIENIGLALKILHDSHPEIRILVTGSSSLDLATKVKEPLTGRTRTYHLYPLAFSELQNQYARFELDSLLESALVYGSYPEVFFLS
jgi:predicted AAA+ superfamily ATPase